MNPLVVRWLEDNTRAFEDAYAITELIQWGLEVEGQERAAHHPLPAQSKDAAVDGGVVVGLGSLGFRIERQAHEDFCTHFVL